MYSMLLSWSPFKTNDKFPPGLAAKDLLPNWDDKWEVEAVISSRFQDGRLQYLIQWKSMD